MSDSKLCVCAPDGTPSCGESWTIVRDGTTLVSNMRITAGTPLLPYRYQESGNFLMTTDGEAIPYYDQFGITQFLVYLTADELATYRGA